MTLKNEMPTPAVEALQVLVAVQQQFRRFSEHLPDGFDSRIFRWVDDVITSLLASPPPTSESVNARVAELEAALNATRVWFSPNTMIGRGMLKTIDDAMMASPNPHRSQHRHRPTDKEINALMDNSSGE